MLVDYLLARYIQKRLYSVHGNMSPADFDRQYWLKPYARAGLSG